MRKQLFILFWLLSSVVFGQRKSLIVFDLLQNTADTVAHIEYDTTITAESTDYFISNLFHEIAELSTQGAILDAFPGTQYARKKRASSDYSLHSYPLGTAVKIFSYSSDSLMDLCSGSMISTKHVITAAHCVSAFQSNELLFNSLHVAPAFDEGSFNPNFSTSDVSKIYLFDSWSFKGEDIAILELVHPIGQSTGYLGIGFEENDALLKEGTFYKFSYPRSGSLLLESRKYNGDTLYYSYGKVDSVSESKMSITNTTATGGESGSTLFKVENGVDYTVYGVLSNALNAGHSRINNERYYTIKSIIKDHLMLNDHLCTKDLVVYPNPVVKNLAITLGQDHEITDLVLKDAKGIEQHLYKSSETGYMLDLSGLQSGLYILQITTPNGIISKRIVKL